MMRDPMTQDSMTRDSITRDLAGLSPGLLTRYLAVFLLLNAFAFNGLLWLVSPEPYKETVLQHTYDVLRGRGCDDSWGIMSVSLEYAQEQHEKPLYSEIFFERKLKFQYPPTSLFAVAGLLWLVGPEGIRTEECKVYDLPTINDVLGWIFILMSALSAAALLELGLQRRGALPAAGFALAARVVIVVALALTFYPLVKAYTLGQIQNWLNGLFALALWCWVSGRKVPSGVVIALMALVKPHYGLFVLWALLRREWRFAAAFAATALVGVLGSIMAYGFTNHVDYLKVLFFLAERGETYYPNQSVNGLLNRVMVLIDPAHWNSIDFDDNAFPPYSLLVYGGTLVASIVLLSAALFRRGSKGDPDRSLDFCTMALSITIASPIAWEHHYGTIFPILAVLLAGVIGDRRRLLLLTISYVLISNYIPVTNLLASTVFNVAQSYLFAGAITVLLLLHTARPGWQLALSPSASRIAGAELKPSG
jgi:alpha-1,2-mannosyltransferase